MGLDGASKFSRWTVDRWRVVGRVGAVLLVVAAFLFAILRTAIFLVGSTRKIAGRKMEKGREKSSSIAKYRYCGFARGQTGKGGGMR